MLSVATAQAVPQEMPENVQHSERNLEPMEAQDLGQYASLPGANSHQRTDIIKIIVLQLHILHVWKVLYAASGHFRANHTEAMVRRYFFCPCWQSGCNELQECASFSMYKAPPKR